MHYLESFMKAESFDVWLLGQLNHVIESQGSGDLDKDLELSKVKLNEALDFQLKYAELPEEEKIKQAELGREESLKRLTAYKIEKEGYVNKITEGITYFKEVETAATDENLKALLTSMIADLEDLLTQVNDITTIEEKLTTIKDQPVDELVAETAYIYDKMVEMGEMMVKNQENQMTRILAVFEDYEAASKRAKFKVVK